MSLDDVFNAFEEEAKKDKAVPEESPEPSKTPESEPIPTPESEEEAKAVAEEEAPTPSEKKDDDSWFGETVEKPVEEKSVDEGSVEEKTEETTTEETPAAETSVEVDDEWFAPDPEKQVSTEITPAVSVDMGTLAGIKTSPIVVCAVTAEVMRASMQQFQSVKASLLDKKDIATIQNKPYIKRSGWRKLGLAFNLSDEIIKEVRDEIDDGFLWRIWVRVWAPNGRSVVGIGGCCSDERDFAHLEHDVYATAHTRAKNRALSDMIGSGEVSWEELRGMN